MTAVPPPESGRLGGCARDDVAHDVCSTRRVAMRAEPATAHRREDGGDTRGPGPFGFAARATEGSDTVAAESGDT
jgi:hypothetical protein